MGSMTMARNQDRAVAATAVVVESLVVAVESVVVVVELVVVAMVEVAGVGPVGLGPVGVVVPQSLLPHLLPLHPHQCQFPGRLDYPTPLRELPSICKGLWRACNRALGRRWPSCVRSFALLWSQGTVTGWSGPWVPCPATRSLQAPCSCVYCRKC